MSVIVFQSDHIKAEIALMGIVPIREQIAFAIAAERERCAKIADLHTASKYAKLKDGTKAARLCAASIAAIIRSGDDP